MRQNGLDFPLLAQIFKAFLKLGPATFGGGYAIIPLIEKEIVEKRGWVDAREMADVTAVASSVPGAVAINSATFIGYRLAGVPGAIAGLVGVLLPTFVIVTILSLFFLKFQDHPKVQAAFVSIRATIVALIAYAAVKIGKTAAVDKTTVVLIAAGAAAMFLLPVHPVLLIVLGGLAGIGLIRLKKKMGIDTKLEQEDPQAYEYSDYFIGDGI